MTDKDIARILKMSWYGEASVSPVRSESSASARHLMHVRWDIAPDEADRPGARFVLRPAWNSLRFPAPLRPAVASASGGDWKLEVGPKSGDKLLLPWP